MDCIWNNSNFTIKDNGWNDFRYKNKKLMAVTTYISKNFRPYFDALKWSEIKAKELNMTQDEVLEMWEDKKKRYVNLGTECHSFANKFIEDNKILTEDTDELISKKKNDFKTFYNTALRTTEIIEREFRIFSEKMRLVGNPDLILFSNDTIIICDYKFSEKMKLVEYETLCEEFSDIYSNDYSIYSIQLSLYKLLLITEIPELKNFKFRLLIISFPDEGDFKIYESMDFEEKLKTHFMKKGIEL